MAKALRRIYTFNSKTTKWESYELILLSYIKINKINDKDRVSLVLTVIGTDIVQLLRELAVPCDLALLSFEKVLKLLQNHFKRKTTKMASRVRFGKMRESETQSID